ncbi:hypothetical protein LOS15_00195 [Halomonas sp. 7T]|uniref:PilW family protein n=1 Tax=Halomonas sp. 7T TaxID=2893469 RepID=UPI0021DA43A8|nr:hypothetical protein [Halomonas sp. 7T]UXZ54497.1 hypothetical protein LOS15_00195 [Halomonas sp. 7T]
MKAVKHQLGAGLVELMVAMAIGTAIALGAGQLFLSTFSTFNSVDELSRKQELAVFLTQILAEGLRKEGDTDRYELSCGIQKAMCLCTIRDTAEGNQPVIDFYKDYEDDHPISNAECSEDQEPLASPVVGKDHQYFVSVPIMKSGESLMFYVTNRDVVTTTHIESE